MGVMKPQSMSAGMVNRVTVLAVPLVITVAECAAMLWEHVIGSPADAMYTLVKEPLGLAALLVTTIVSSAILLIRYRLPAMALALETVLLLAASYWQLDSVVMIQTLVACYAFVRVAGERDLCVGGVAMLLAMTASTAMVHPNIFSTEWVSRVVTLAAVGGGALAVRSRQQAKAADREAAEERWKASVLVTQRDAAVRRSRIAGQLHDSVGHGLTAIIALSEGLTGKTGDPRVEDALRGINEIARESLADTRDAVRALTDFDEMANGDGRGKQELERHSWDDIRPILAHARALGIVTVFTETGMRTDDEAQANLCFDVTREAITNATRYGRDAAHINVAWNHTENAAVTAIIRNDGAFLGSPLRGELSPKATEGRPAYKDAGTGLARLARRIESIGGTFEYGPDENGDWTVTAVIPSVSGTGKDLAA